MSLLIDCRNGMRWRKGNTFVGFVTRPPFASGKPQNFNAVFTTAKSGRLAGRPGGCILTNAG
jgi:hypothetical protein